MGYDERLASRIRDVLVGETGVVERRMFGGLAFMINGNMAVAASSQGGLMLHVDPEQSGSLLAEPHVHMVEMRGRSLAGWLHVDQAAVTSDDDLKRWVSQGTSYAHSLPPK